MLVIRAFVTISLLLSTLSDTPKDKGLFISPVRIPLLLSANFGELRSDHFHSGIDIKTQGVTGQDVVAAADGYIYRISVSPGGFGNALYIRHPSGFSTVYGHLESFMPEIQRFVKEKQYERKSYSLNLYLNEETFPVKQGELIAHSGNSGSSGGPHLHYEIRRSDGERPVNPLKFEFGATDNINPVIEKLVIYPLSKNSQVNGKNEPYRTDVSGGHGNYYIPVEKVITINGKAGFGIKAFDLLNESYNRCSVYSIELIIDSMTVYKYLMDDFSFSESRYINSHVDYETYVRNKTFIHRAFILPNDKLSVYKGSVNRGIYTFTEARKYNIRIIVSDIHKNTSVLSFNIRAENEEIPAVTADNEKGTVIMPYNRQNRFLADKIIVSIPPHSLYDTLLFRYNYTDPESDMLSGIHHVHNKFTPVHRAYSLSIKPDTILKGLESRMLIVQTAEDNKKSALKTTWKDGYLIAEPTTFGDFMTDIDTVPPVILSNGLLNNTNLTSKKEIRIKIKDDLSGIKSYWPEIDGKWALFEYDQKNDVIIYRFDEKRIVRNSEHVLILTVTDNKDNVSKFSYNFEW